MRKTLLILISVIGCFLVSALIYAHINRTSTLAYILNLEPSYEDMKNGIPLYRDFMSYDNPSKIITFLTDNHVAYSIEGEFELPQVSSATIICEPGSFPNFDGQAYFNFFNDRLSSVLLFPHNNSYSYQEAKHITPTERKHLMIESITDHQGRAYIRISDERLEDEHTMWIFHNA